MDLFIVICAVIGGVLWWRWINFKAENGGQ